ncbi:MAG: tripartite tricarboxylate transporter substrate binding protein [Deltaproteobacteria bacterium]|nr:tripartite tricarboxylate transporter substrate binding protein [Deltaproteobacteria bacterium]
MIVRLLFSMLIVAGPLWGASLAGAQAVNYPTKPIILQVPWPAGGSTDVGARIVAAIAEKKMGQPIVVTNRVGAGSQIGLTETARAKPDGYTLGFASLPALNTIVLDPERKALFDLNSLVFITNQVIDPGIIWAKGDSPYKTLKDLLEDARKRPGEIRAATTGILGDDHLAILMLEQAAKVKFRIVHFDGGAQVFTAALGGQVDVAFGNVGDIGTKLKGTPLRILMVMDPQRSKFVPDVPTTAELGFPGIISSSSRGMFGPAGIPDPILKKIQEVFLEAMKNPEHVDKMDKAALAVRPLVGEEYKKYVYDLHQRIIPLMETARKSQ